MTDTPGIQDPDLQELTIAALQLTNRELNTELAMRYQQIEDLRTENTQLKAELRRAQ